MCLSTNIKMMVAKKDIVCYKSLSKHSKDTYTTPCRGTIVKLNRELVANQQNRSYNEEGFNSIEGGFIHALLCFNEAGGGFGKKCVVFKAIIPAGTEFFINNEFTQICARKMFITDEKVSVKDGKNGLVKQLYDTLDAIMPQEIKDSEIAIGDFCVVDDNGEKRYIHRSQYIPEIDDDIIGVVGFFNEDGKPVVLSRKETEKEWSKLEWGKRPLINASVDYDNREKSFNGKELTNSVINSSGYKDKDYPAFKYIKEFKTKGTKADDWYIGAIGELKKMSHNTLQINISLMMLKDADLLYFWLWSSSECNGYHAWFLGPSNGYVLSYFKHGSHRVRAFAAFNA